MERKQTLLNIIIGNIIVDLSLDLKFRHEGLTHLFGPVNPTLPRSMYSLWTVLLGRKEFLSILIHFCQHQFFLETFHLVLRKGSLHATNRILHASKFINFFSDQISVLVEIFLRVYS